MGVLVASAEEEQQREGIQSRHWIVICGALIGAIVLCLGIDAVFDRNFEKNISDGVAYLDISDALMHGNPNAFRNPYWSPAYPVVLSLGLTLLHPRPPLELAAVYGIHWAIGLLALACLIYFVRGLPNPTESPGFFGLPRAMLAAAACALFLVAAQADVPIYLMTPDLLLGAWLWLAGGAFLRISRNQRIYDYALLALAISLAYFTKAAALTLALTALPLLPFTGPNRKKSVRGGLLYAAIVLVLISPYIARLSEAKGRFTFGESGSLNYAWIVDGADVSGNRWHLQNDSPSGHARLALVHPARRLMKSPDVYEFAAPIQGTYPAFDDPSYWNDGLKPVLYLKGEVWHIAMNLYHTLSWLARRGEFVVALILLLMVQLRSRTRGPWREVLPVLLWFASLWGVYLLVDVEDRYVFAALTAILLLAAATVRVPDSGNLRRIAAACTLILAGGAAIRALDAAGEKVYFGVKQKYVGTAKMKSVGPYQNPYSEIAEILKNKLALRPNDSVACMQLGCDNPYWARLAGLRVTADLSAESDYWKATPAHRAQAMAALAGAGVKAVVARNLGPGAESEGWVPLGDPHDKSQQELYARPTK
jgi:hypothetical protein